MVLQEPCFVPPFEVGSVMNMVYNFPHYALLRKSAL